MDQDSPSSLCPTLLEPPPPATVISPPSPTKDKTVTKDTSPSQPQLISSQAFPTIESPGSLPQSTADSPPPMVTPLPAPASPAFLRPTSPPSASSSLATTVRSPSPSSPSLRPKGLHHRRTSSTHRVRETIDGTQTANKYGERMINQYKIGMSLGQGAYAKVELGVDIHTGVKYVSLASIFLLLIDMRSNRQSKSFQNPGSITSLLRRNIVQTCEVNYGMEGCERQWVKIKGKVENGRHNLVKRRSPAFWTAHNLETRRRKTHWG